MLAIFENVLGSKRNRLKMKMFQCLEWNFTELATVSYSGIIVIHLMQEVDVLLRNHCVLLSVNDKRRTPNPVHLEETPSNMDDLSLVSLETEKLKIGFGFPKQFFL